MNIPDLQNPHSQSPWIAYIGQILDPTGLLPVSITPDEDGEPSYELFRWDSEDVDKPTEAEFLAAANQAKAMSYQLSRRMAYPSIADQLDMMFHDPELWRSAIQEVKDRYPKPSASS